MLIDLRSDTVTQPTPEMREAMATAQVGDDVFGDDPTVNRLEEIAAEKVGKDAALFVPSGTMANLLALITHCQRGEEVILGLDSHIYQNEVAGMAVVGGLQAHPLNDSDGRIKPWDIEAAIRPDNIHMPSTALVCMENTHNRASGIVTSMPDMEAVAEVARRHNLKLHLDGARIFNASVYLGVRAADLARPFDSVYVCLSKGLGAPVGSILAGPRDFIDRVRKNRKMLGGGMRQAGVIAAAGIISLTKMVDRLADDHRAARRLAEGLNGIPSIEIDLSKVQTNILFLTLTHPGLSAAEISAQLGRYGILTNPAGPTRMRLVTHHHVSTADVDTVIEAFREVVAGADAQLSKSSASV